MLFFCGLFWLPTASAQLYYPPVSGNQWDTLSPAALGISATAIDSLYQFLDGKNTKAFMVLKDGKILYEKYFGTFVRDSIWYWASAGKSMTGFAVGMAQEQGLLHINDLVSAYLGTGWTSATPAQEGDIRIRHQLSMTNGLDDNVPDDNCTTPACLQYLAPAGTRWAYHNAPYHLVHDVVAAAAGQSWQQFYNQEIAQRTGINGLWVDHVMYSRARNFARFGLLILGKGIWDGDTLLADTAYFNAMLRPSQTYNLAYGYLWWLNGQSSYMVPDLQFQIPGMLIPDAPADLVAGLGKNDQKVYVIPSRQLVVIRMGEGAGFANPVAFDRELWPYLSAALPGGPVSLPPSPASTLIACWPNPARECVSVALEEGNYTAQWVNLTGQILIAKQLPSASPQFETPPVAGLYWLLIRDVTRNKSYAARVLVQ